MDKSRLMNTFLELCKIASITGSPGETAMPEKLAEIIMQIPYFQANPGNINIYEIPNDSAGRTFIFALMEGEPKSSKTVVLLSHYDVVGVEEYGVVKGMAFDPEQLTEYLRSSGKIEMPADVKKDIISGDYLFGRGTMDMKFGIAVNIESLFQMGNDLSSWQGNILFVSVPDEEANSAGMLAAVHKLLAFREERGLEYKCCLVSEPYLPKFPGDTRKYIYTGGAVGKLLPIFYCVGRETHACEPYSGLNPNLLTAAIIDLIEQNPELTDEFRGYRVPSPICLKQADTKKDYSVQTPTAAYTYFSYMTINATPGEVIEQMTTIARQAFDNVLEGYNKKVSRWEELTGSKLHVPATEPKVVTYRDLYNQCIEIHGASFERHITEFVQKSRITDQRKLSIELVREVHSFCPDREPMIIVLFAPPFYPHTRISDDEGIVMNVSRQLVEIAKQEFGEALCLSPFFPGLSDMSYLNVSRHLDISALGDNLPLWGTKYSVPLAEIALLDIPFINLGPQGKDPHKLTERLNVPYSFDVAAPLIHRAVKLILSVDEG